ncbi:hypothetical protein HanLR1_Chr10g0366961 [Helianthus annuus]|nr:hypothetical protein HanLR1_Chr10g0366961 [Helianthus annuus]
MERERLTARERESPGTASYQRLMPPLTSVGHPSEPPPATHPSDHPPPLKET